MAHCIDINNFKVKEISDILGSPKLVIAAKIALWQEQNNTEKFPTAEELKQDIESTLSTGTQISSNISNKLDEKGNEIANTLGAYMNAIVDAAKDPFITRANLNQYTAGTAFMLARAGVEREWITAFIGQPILRDVVAAQAAQEGRFGKPVYSEQKGKRLSAIEIVLEKYGITADEKAFRGLESYPTLRRSKDADIKLTTEDLVKNIKSENMESAVYKAEQLKVLKQFLEWQNKASQLNDVIKVAKADVEGATKTLMTAQLAENLLKKVLHEKNIGNVESYFGINLDEKGDLAFKQGIEGKMIGRYFENSVTASLKRFRRFFIASSNAAQSLTEKVATWAGYDELVTNSQVEKLIYTISNDIYAMVATDTSVFNISPEELRVLLYGSGPQTLGGQQTLSLANRVEMAKNSELATNLLINGLQIMPGREGAPDKVYLPNTETVKETKEALFQAWEELFQIDAKSGDTLARDLAVYAFYSSGFAKSVGDFSEHIPNGWLKANNFHTEITEKNAEFEDVSALAGKEDILFKNLYKDNQLVPVVSDKSAVAISWTDGKSLALSKDVAFMIPAHDSANYIIGEGPAGKVFKRFVKRKVITKDINGNITDTELQLFKLMGYTHNNNAVYVRTNTLGISGYGNNIKEYNGDGNTSIFPKNNVTIPEGLKSLVDELEQRGSVTGDLYSEINTKLITDSDFEDRLQFCIMK